MHLLSLYPSVPSWPMAILTDFASSSVISNWDASALIFPCDLLLRVRRRRELGQNSVRLLPRPRGWRGRHALRRRVRWQTEVPNCPMPGYAGPGSFPITRV